MRRRWIEQFAVIVALCAVAGTANAQSAPEPLPASGASDVARTVTPGFRFAAPAQAAAITADRMLLLAPDGAAVRGLVRTSGDRAVFEPTMPLVGCTTYTLLLNAPERVRSRFTTACSAWNAPVQIDDSHTAHKVDLPVSGTQVAATADGGFVAVWFQDDADRRAILATRFNPDTQAWSRPQAIDLQGPQAGASSIPAITADRQGRLTVVWFQAVDGRNAVFAARSDGGAWQAPQRLDQPALPGNATNPQLAADAAGNVTVVWQQPNGRHTAIYAAHWQQATLRWLPAQPIDRGPANAYNPVIAATPQGRVVAAWQQGTSGREAVFAAALQPSGQSWGAPRRLSAEGIAATSPALTATPQETIVAAWVQGRDALRRIAVSQLLPEGSGAAFRWSAPQIQHSTAFTGPALSPALTADAAGDLTLVWEQAKSAQGGPVRYAILAARRDAGADAASARWSPPQQIDAPALRSAGNPVLVTDAAGNVRCAWYQDGPSGMQVQTARYNPAEQRWQAPQTLSDPSATVQASFPALAVDAVGSTMAVWQQFNGWRTLAVARWLP